TRLSQKGSLRTPSYKPGGSPYQAKQRACNEKCAGRLSRSSRLRRASASCIAARGNRVLITAVLLPGYDADRDPCATFFARRRRPGWCRGRCCACHWSESPYGVTTLNDLDPERFTLRQAAKAR